ncbi:hypothetical protein SCB49_01122 [unidentified eubacterium SCB49]|nr:hypothetical protein SCB49_01122 [unidentified eubacterium SCB49]
MKRQLFYIVLFLLTTSLFAQTSNEGVVYVSPGTQFSTVEDFNNLSTASFINDGEAFIYAHFNNDGVVDFIEDTGYTRFEGKAVQKISGGSTSYFYDVLFNNNISDVASFELSNELSVAGEADFDEGIVKNDDFGGLVVFETEATHTGVFDRSHVDGYVQKTGDKSFVYPIGDKGFYRFAAISAPDDLGDVFTSKYFLEPTNDSYPLENRTGILEAIDGAEHWTLTKEGGVTDVLLTLSWEDTTTPENITAQPQVGTIRVVRWNEEGGLWVDEGGVVDVDNKTVTTAIALEEYGVFTLGRIKSGVILPGDVVVYNGVTPNGDGNNDYFIIDNIENLANNSVEIYNRWGVKVFETTDYDSSDNVFRGFSEGRLTIQENEKLPSGTYFYVLNYDFTDANGTERVKQAGYLYLNGD